MVCPVLRWKGLELEALRTAYETTSLKVVELAVEFRTSPANVSRLAMRNGWKRRGAERLPDAAHQHWTLYRKMQAIVGRDAALAALQVSP